MKKRTFKPIEITVVSMFTALMTIGANIAPILTIGGVPITLQLLFAILAGILLGSRLGAMSMVTYMLVGLMGAPVFAQFKGGFSQVFSPTFGFILSFIAVAYIAGKIIEAKAKPTTFTFFMASFTGVFLNYMIGTNLMYVAYLLWVEAPPGFSYVMAWSWLAIYLPIDLVVATVTTLASPRLFYLIKRSSLFNRANVEY